MPGTRSRLAKYVYNKEISARLGELDAAGKALAERLRYPQITTLNQIEDAAIKTYQLNSFPYK